MSSDAFVASHLRDIFRNKVSPVSTHSLILSGNHIYVVLGYHVPQSVYALVHVYFCFVSVTFYFHFYVHFLVAFMKSTGINAFNLFVINH